MIFILCAAITSFVITLIAIPSIIKIADIKQLYDEPSQRKIHTVATPTLGGVAIFAGLILSLTFWASQKEIVELQYIITGLTIFFFMGVKDDLFDLVAWKKFMGQLFVAFILVHFADIRVNTFYGLLGIYDINLATCYFLSIFTIIVITNSFNLIDGINGLAGSVGVIASVTFGTWFFLMNSTQYAILAFCLVGALLAFLFYNVSPAKIFMGDTGSLMCGLVLSLLAIKFIEMNRVMDITAHYKILSVPVVAIGILIVPLFDTIRVFIIRLLKKKSPFLGDKNHIHHELLKIGLSHMQVTSISLMFNLGMVLFVFTFQSLRGEALISLVIGICLLSSFILKFLVNKNEVT